MSSSRRASAPAAGRAYTPPFGPAGTSSIVDHPPWHFASDVIQVVYRTDPEAVRSLLPAPLEPGPEPDRVSVRVTEVISVGDSDPDLAYRQPEATQYGEAIVTVSCQYEGEAGVYLPFIWTDHDWSMMRGWLNGWPKKVAAIRMTRLHPLHPKLRPLGPGARLGGVLSRHGERILFAGVTLEEPGRPEDLPRLGTYFGVRYLPSVDPHAPPSVHELVRVETAGRVVTDVWKGSGELELYDAENEELMPLRPRGIESGYYFRSGWTNLGGAVVARLGGGPV
ncbi:MAG: acetoacetate decarboxylase family protein [Thermoplasmata archaeon]